VEHDLETLLAQRVHGIALGYEDLNDHDALRHDPVLGLVSGKLEARRSDCAVLAGKLVPAKKLVNESEFSGGARSSRQQGERRRWRSLP